VSELVWGTLISWHGPNKHKLEYGLIKPDNPVYGGFIILPPQALNAGGWGYKPPKVGSRLGVDIVTRAIRVLKIKEPASEQEPVARTRDPEPEVSGDEQVGPGD
jgi:hypothetical protein